MGPETMMGDTGSLSHSELRNELGCISIEIAFRPSHGMLQTPCVDDLPRGREASISHVSD